MAAFSNLQQPPALILGTRPTLNMGRPPTLRPHPPLPPPPPPPPHQNEDGDGGGGGIGAFSPLQIQGLDSFMGSLGVGGGSGSGGLGQYGDNLEQYGASLGQQQQPGWEGGPLDLPGLVQGLMWLSSGALGGGAGGGLAGVGGDGVSA